MSFPKNLPNIKYLGVNSGFKSKLWGSKQKIDNYAKKAITEVYGPHEVVFVSNTYHRCPKTLESMYEELKRYLPTEKAKSTCQHYRKALEMLVKDINVTEKFKMINFDGLGYVPQNYKASAEMPYVMDITFKEYLQNRFKSGEIPNSYPTKGNGLPYILCKEKTTINEIREGKRSYEQTHHSRVHSKSPLTTVDKRKLRLIAGTPMTTIYIEIMLVHALNVHLQRNKNAIAWGYETYKGGLVRLADEFKSYNSFISLDFSAFDKRIPHWLIKDIHTVWKSLSSLDKYYSDPSTVRTLFANKSETERLWQYMTDAATIERLIMPDGHMFQRVHSGFGSGLYQTQLLGSHANFVMINAAMLYCGFSPDSFELKVLGDDSVIAFNYNGSLQGLLGKITNYLMKEFNAVVNVEKSVAYTGVRNLQFLSYKLINGEVRRVKNDLLGRLLYPEKDNSSLKNIKTRTLGMMIANFGFDEKIHKVCVKILRMLNSVDIDIDSINLYDKFRLQTMFCRNIGQEPTREELKKMALTYDIMYDNEYIFEDFFK